MKTCSLCGKTKALSSFAADTSKNKSSDGMMPTCRDCVSMQNEKNMYSDTPTY